MGRIKLSPDGSDYAKPNPGKRWRELKQEYPTQAAEFMTLINGGDPDMLGRYLNETFGGTYTVELWFETCVTWRALQEGILLRSGVRGREAFNLVLDFNAPGEPGGSNPGSVYYAWHPNDRRWVDVDEDGQLHLKIHGPHVRVGQGFAMTHVTCRVRLLPDETSIMDALGFVNKVLGGCGYTHRNAQIYDITSDKRTKRMTVYVPAHETTWSSKQRLRLPYLKHPTHQFLEGDVVRARTAVGYYWTSDTSTCLAEDRAAAAESVPGVIAYMNEVLDPMSQKYAIFDSRSDAHETMMNDKSSYVRSRQFGMTQFIDGLPADDTRRIVSTYLLDPTTYTQRWLELADKPNTKPYEGVEIVGPEMTGKLRIRREITFESIPGEAVLIGGVDFDD